MKGTSLFAAVVAALVAFTAYDYWSSQKKDEAKAAREQIVRVDKATLDLIEVAGAKNHFRLEKVDGHWSLTEPFQESADQQVVMTYIEQLFGEKSQAEVANASGDARAAMLAKYGLSEPLFTLHVASAGGPAGVAREQRVAIGSVRAFDNSLYAQIDDEPRVILVNSSWDSMLSKLPSEFRDTKLYHGPMTVDFDSIKVTGASSYEFSRKNGAYVLKNATEPVDQAAVKAWLEQIKALRGAAFVENPKPGFKAETTITLKIADKDPYLLQVAHDRDHPQQFEATSSDLPGARFASRVLVSPRALDSILLRPENFYDRGAAFAFDPKQVALVRFNDQGQTRETKVDPGKPDELINRISQLKAIRYLGRVSSEKKFPSRLTLLKSDGTLVFEMSWGDPVIEKSDAGVESQIVPVKTNLSKQMIGVPEKSIRDIARTPTATEEPTSAAGKTSDVSGASEPSESNDEKGR
jgi:hypothetical protein